MTKTHQGCHSYTQDRSLHCLKQITPNQAHLIALTEQLRLSYIQRNY
jgi:hypothetical protein